MAYPQQRIFNLAQRLGISVRDAASLCGRKGARRRAAKQCACLPPDAQEAERAERIRKLRWDLREDAA
jgi:hypothetical protein